jgi:hypothetical protein
LKKVLDKLKRMWYNIKAAFEKENSKVSWKLNNALRNKNPWDSFESKETKRVIASNRNESGRF